MGGSDDFIIICPACGFSFKTFDPNSRKKVKVCPMCGYKISEPNFPSKDPNTFKKRIL